MATQTSRVHIAFFLPNIEMGGAERVIINISAELAKRGHRVELILAHKHGALIDDVHPGVTITDLKAFRKQEPIWLFGLRTVLRLTQHLRSSPPDALISTLTGANISAILAKILSRQRIFLAIREASAAANTKSRTRQLLIKRLYPSADAIIVLTELMRNRMHQELGVGLEKIHLIGNPIDETKVRKLSLETSTLKEANRLKPYVVSVGRLSEPKDNATIIRAVAQLVTEEPINLVIVGEGPERERLKTIARDLCIQEIVHFIGQKNNPYPWIAAADALILSSKWEGFPNVLLEAQALNTPIVATEYDESIHEILQHCNYPSRTVAIGDDHAMASAISFLRKAPHHQSNKKSKDNSLRSIANEFERLIHNCRFAKKR